MAQRRGVGPGAFPFLALAFGLAANASERPAVLNLAVGEPGLPWTELITRGFRDVVDADPRSPVQYFEFLDGARFHEPEYEDRFREWLRWKYRNRRIDLILARGSRSMEFLARGGGEPWPDVPVLGSDLGSISVPLSDLPRATGMILEDHAPEALGVVKLLFPETRRVAVAYGAADVEGGYFPWFSMRVREAGLEPIDLGGLAMDDLLDRVTLLPERTVLFYFSIQVDGAGRSFPANAPCELISKAANRPLFSLYGFDFGCGVVGGRLLDFYVWGQAMGELSLDHLRGRPLETVTIPIARHTRLRFDARQLERWGIPEGRVPTGSSVEFRSHSLWRDYRAQALGALAIAAVQTVLIVGLWLEHRRRRRAELSARRHLVTMSHLDRRAAMGELAASLAHEIGQPLGAILANAKAAELMLDEGAADARELREILDDIRSDDLRAAGIIRGMRELLQKRELTTERIDLNRLVEDTVAIVAPDAKSRAIDVDINLLPGLAAASGGRIYLQQVLLNLLLNGIAAVAEETPERRRLQVETAERDGALEVIVSDRGHGIPPDRLNAVFEPFVTTKEGGLGVGLSIARSIVEAHRGRITAENNADGGATFRFSLPQYRNE